MGGKCGGEGEAFTKRFHIFHIFNASLSPLPANMREAIIGTLTIWFMVIVLSSGPLMLNLGKMVPKGKGFSLSSRGSSS